MQKRIRQKRVEGWVAFEKKTAEVNANAAKQHKDKLLMDADVPPRFRGITLEGFASKYGDAAKMEAIKAAATFIQQRKIPKPNGDAFYGIYLYGPFGVGKTSILSTVFAALADKLGGGLWLPFASFMDQVRGGYEDGTAQAIKKSAMTAPILMLEDFGSLARDSETAHTVDVMLQIVYHRNGYNLPTLITSNLSGEELAVQFNGAITQRLRELLKVIHVGGKVIRQLG